MGTNELNVKKYQNLWQKFEGLLLEKELNLSSFAQEWIKYDEKGEDYYKVFDRLKKQKNRKNKSKKVQNKSLEQMEEYIKFLDKDFTAVNIRSDELYEHWFD